MSRTPKQIRAELYARWLRDDADGLACNLPPADPASIQELRNARAKLREALRTVDQAIDRCETVALALELKATTQEPA